MARVLRQRGCVLAPYAVAVVLVPQVISGSRSEPSPIAQRVVTPAVVSAPAGVSDEVRALSGIWWRYEAGAEGERVRFYYFHGDGTGLYRYGRVGLNNTHSFDYDVRGSTLVIDFRKTGEHHEVPFSVELGGTDDEARDWLELSDDPRESGATRYFRESDEMVRSASGSADLGPAPAGHMWIDLQHFATGGQGFAFYQFRPAGIDGRGVGWFHRGDFNDWSTEALTYRIVGQRMELHFTLADRHEQTAFSLATDDDGARWLELTDDPRDYWHPHRYLDIGPSFGMVGSLGPVGAAPARP